MALALQLWLGTGPRVVCLGGGGDFPTDATQSHLGTACEHARFVPVCPSSEQPHECDCNDVELNVAELQSTLSQNTSVALVALPTPLDSLSVLAPASSLASWIRPEPPWFDPRLERQLTVVDCARLTI